MADVAYKDFGDVESRIDRPGENVLIDYEFHGDVVAGTVVVKGGSVHGAIEALEVFVDGLVDGKVSSKMLTVSASGSLRGEGRADMARIGGNFRGLLIAETVLAKKSGRIEGYVLADSWGVEPGAQVKATIYAEAGISTRKDLVDTARAGLARAEAKSAVGISRRAETPAPETSRQEPVPAVAEAESHDVTPSRPIFPPKAPEPIEAEPDQLARELRDTVIRELGRPAEIAPVPKRAAAPKADVPSIGRLFQLGGASSGDDRRPRII